MFSALHNLTGPISELVILVGLARNRPTRRHGDTEQLIEGVVAVGLVVFRVVGGDLGQALCGVVAVVEGVAALDTTGFAVAVIEADMVLTVAPGPALRWAERVVAGGADQGLAVDAEAVDLAVGVVAVGDLCAAGVFDAGQAPVAVITPDLRHGQGADGLDFLADATQGVVTPGGVAAGVGEFAEFAFAVAAGVPGGADGLVAVDGFGEAV